MKRDRPSVCVFAPTLFVTITVEAGENGADEIHFHAGGQGYWLARMVAALGERPILCAPVGGESGAVLRALLNLAAFDFGPVPVAGANPAYVHDRRRGERVEVAEGVAPPLDRHELDDFYDRTLTHSLAAGVAVVTGRRNGDEVPVDFYRRLSADLQRNEVPAIGDLHGEELWAFLEGGPLALLKVSDDDLAEDGILTAGEEEAAWDAVERLSRQGVEGMVVSRAERPALARFGDIRLRATPPRLEAVDTRGSGDSMAAAIVVAGVRGLSPEETLRMACAAGAANVTRHGLGSARPDLVAQLAARVEVEHL